MQKFALLSLILTAASSQAMAQIGQGNIMLGGDKAPDRIISQYQATCGRNAITIRIQSESQISTSLLDVAVNGQSFVDAAEYLPLKQFIAGMTYPYVTDVKCPAGGISVVVAGRPRVGDDTTYRVTFPVK